MTIQEILNTTNHRPWKMPTRSWKFYQEWNHAIFLHWQVELSELKKFVPKELEIDLFEGKPWVSLVAFTMEKIRPRFMPAFSPVSNFNEINIRTYIKSKHKTGVYFLSIEGGKRASCFLARAISELPYRYSKIKRKPGSFVSENTTLGDSIEIEFNIGQKQNKEELDDWLTERYALFQETKKAINEYEIHHLEWPINELTLKKTDINYRRFSNLIKTEPDKTQYSKGVKVIAWKKKKRSKTSYKT